MKKRFLILSLFMFLLVPVVVFFSGCSNPDPEKIKLNMFNALGKCVYLCIIMQNKN